MTSLINRFINYVKYDTQSDELTNLTPSTPGQMAFARVLEQELHAMGLSDISLDDVYLASSMIANAAHPDANIIWGAAFDPNLQDELRITIIATGTRNSSPNLTTMWASNSSSPTALRCSVPTTRLVSPRFSPPWNGCSNTPR